LNGNQATEEGGGLVVGDFPRFRDEDLQERRTSDRDTWKNVAPGRRRKQKVGGEKPARNMGNFQKSRGQNGPTPPLGRKGTKHLMHELGK